jgi:hypothetical protein
LFIIDKFAGAKRLIDEMSIVSTRMVPSKSQIDTPELSNQTEMN